MSLHASNFFHLCGSVMLTKVGGGPPVRRSRGQLGLRALRSWPHRRSGAWPSSRGRARPLAMQCSSRALRATRSVARRSAHRACTCAARRTSMDAVLACAHPVRAASHRLQFQWCRATLRSCFLLPCEHVGSAAMGRAARCHLPQLWAGWNLLAPAAARAAAHVRPAAVRWRSE